MEKKRFGKTFEQRQAERAKWQDKSSTVVKYSDYFWFHLLFREMPSTVLLVAIEGCGVSEEQLGSIQIEGVEVRKVHCKNEYKDIHDKLKDEKLASYKAIVVLGIGTNQKEVLIKGNACNGEYSGKRINTKRPKEHEKNTEINLDAVQKSLEDEGRIVKQLTGGQKSSSFTLYKCLSQNAKSLVAFIPKEGNKDDVVNCVVKYLSE